MADMSDPAGTLPHAGGCNPLFQSRVAGYALLRDNTLFVEIDALVRTGLGAKTIAMTSLFIDEDDAFLLATVDRISRAGFQAGRVFAVHANERQIKEIRVRIFAAAHVLVPVPVRTPVRGGAVALPWPQIILILLAVAAAKESSVILEIPGLAPVPLAGQRTRYRLAVPESAAQLERISRRTLPRHGIDDVPPHRVHAVAPRPVRLAPDTAGLAAQALVEIEHHRELVLFCRRNVHNAPASDGCIRPSR